MRERLFNYLVSIVHNNQKENMMLQAIGCFCVIRFFVKFDGKSFRSLGKYISERNKTVRRRSFFILALSVFSVLPLYYKTS